MTERQSKLIKLVNLYQKIEVSRLAELLDVSQVTIRKDLDHLEEEGLLSREHGYALIKNANDINTRLTINYDKKLEIRPQRLLRWFLMAKQLCLNLALLVLYLQNSLRS